MRKAKRFQKISENSGRCVGWTQSSALFRYVQASLLEHLTVDEDKLNEIKQKKLLHKLIQRHGKIKGNLGLLPQILVY